MSTLYDFQYDVGYQLTQMLKDVNENNYLTNAYSKQLSEINNDIDNLKSSIDEDLKNYQEILLA